MKVVSREDIALSAAPVISMAAQSNVQTQVLGEIWCGSISRKALLIQPTIDRWLLHCSSLLANHMFPTNRRAI